MRVECEACREIAVVTVAVSEGNVIVTCGACGAVTRVIPEAVALPPEALCPKCGEPRRGDRACVGCGLAAERMAAFAADREAAVAEQVRAGWDRVCETWDDPARHDVLLQLVASHGAYAWAAGRYRDAARTRKGDGIATRQLDRLRRAAEATLFASAGTRPDRTPTPYRATMTILAMMIVAVVIGLLYAVLTRDGDTTDTATHSTPAVAPQPGTR